MHIRRNDEVQVIRGDDKGATGRVLFTFSYACMSMSDAPPPVQWSVKVNP